MLWRFTQSDGHIAKQHDHLAGMSLLLFTFTWLQDNMRELQRKQNVMFEVFGKHLSAAQMEQCKKEIDAEMNKKGIWIRFVRFYYVLRLILF